MLNLSELCKNNIYYFLQLFIRYLKIFLFFILMRLMVNLIDNIILNVLRNSPLPKINIFPNFLILYQFEQIMFLGSLPRFINLKIESGSEHLAVDRDTSIHRVIVFIQNDAQQLSKLEEGLHVVDFEEAFDPELIEQVDEKLLSLLVPHYLSKPPELILVELLLPIPSLQNNFVDVLFQTGIEISLNDLLVIQ